jgi:LuxR family maltose regulon positive regulatory protein
VAKKPDVRSVKQPPAQNSRSHTPPSFMFRPVRTRLLDELEGQGHGGPKLLSIVAPIGYGKTVLMSELYAHRQMSGERCYWVGLDDRDAGIQRLLSSLEIALAGHEEEVHPTQTLLRGDESVESSIDELIGAIEGLPVPATIFIDNLNSCTDPSLGRLLDALVFQTPVSIRLVWSSTTELAIDLGRAKLEGLIRQIGFSDLSFGAGETRELLGAEIEKQIHLSGVETILRHTEGWPAAVRMAQIVLADAAQPQAALEAFSGSDEDVAALLKRQVLQGFTPALREFLLCLAQLRIFSVELCRHAIGDANAQRHIDYLLSRNVFIIPLDRNRKWYRLHGLFREYLQSEATRLLDLEQRREVLKRAADWCARNSEWRDAIDYALASGEAAAASRMLDQTATIFLRDRGDSQQYIDWAARLEAENVQIGWEAHFWYVWALVFCRRYELGRMQHEKLAERLRRFSGTTDVPPDDLSQRIDHLRICIDLFTDRLADSDAGAARWLTVAKTSDPYNLASIHCIKSCCLASSFRFADARKAMSVAEPIMLEVSGAYTAGWITLIYAMLSIYEGDYSLALKGLQAGLSRAAEALGEDSGLCGNLSLLAAGCAVEMGRDDEARGMVVSGLRTAHSHGLVGIIAIGFDAAVKLWQGGADESISIPKLREIASSYPARLSLTLSCYLVQRLLHLGRMSDAVIEAERIGLGLPGGKTLVPDADALAIPHYRDAFAATAIDFHIAHREFKRAETLIAELMPMAQAEGRVSRVVALALAKATIAIRKGNRRAATKELVHAISVGARGRVVRPFLDQAETIVDLVNDTKISSWPFVPSEEREFFAHICRSLPISNRFLHELSTFAASEQRASAKPTRREIELIQLVDLGLSNDQIADRTEASVNTIKWHLNNLYRKLGVSNRSAALARARALNLLPK